MNCVLPNEGSRGSDPRPSAQQWVGYQHLWLSDLWLVRHRYQFIPPAGHKPSVASQTPAG